MDKMALRRFSPVYVPFLFLLLSFTLAMGALVLAPGEAQALPYTEVSDAGNKFSPQNLPGGQYTGITGNIGGADDPTDAFRFIWAGGEFRASITGPARLFVYLYNLDNGRSYYWESSGQEPTPFEPGFWERGFCILEISVNATSDPTYEITFSSPVTGVPLPGSLLLLGAGLLCLAVYRRRKLSTS